MLRWTFPIVFFCGCQSVADGAKEQFSRENTCPLDRVEARARSELKPSQFRQKAAAPDDIAADPARLKMWQERQAKSTGYDDEYHYVVEVRGCDKHVFYECTHPGSGSTPGVRWMCMPESYVPDTISKW